MKTAEEYFSEWWTQDKHENGFNITAMLDFADYVLESKREEIERKAFEVGYSYGYFSLGNNGVVEHEMKADYNKWKKSQNKE